MHLTSAPGDLVSLVCFFYFLALFFLFVLGGLLSLMVLIYGAMLWGEPRQPAVAALPVRTAQDQLAREPPRHAVPLP